MNPLAVFGISEKVAKMIFGAIIAIVIAIFVYKLIVKWKRRNAGKQYVDTSNLNPNVNYDALAKGVFDATDGWLPLSGSSLEEIAGQLVVLNNNEIKQVNNRYLELYGKGTDTLQDAFDKSWVCINCPNLDTLRKRLAAIGIN